MNNTGAYLSPVAQMLSMIAKLLAEEGSTVQGLPQPAGAPALPLTLAAIGLGTDAPLCIHAAAVCSGHGQRVLAVNRCNRPAKLAMAGACGGGLSGYSSLTIYNASTRRPGRDWAQAAGQQPWGPMVPKTQAAAEGKEGPTLQPFALSVVALKSDDPDRPRSREPRSPPQPTPRSPPQPRASSCPLPECVCLRMDRRLLSTPGC
eukprot:SAG11_NODE_6568_length_1287_cov_1.214646_2_plen_204_part_00